MSWVCDLTFLFLPCCTGPVDVKKKLRVAVIGAGAAGLCAVRHCSKFTDCITVTLYEQGPDIVVGGKCASHNGILPNNLHTQLR